jgi:hypothetical protein
MQVIQSTLIEPSENQKLLEIAGYTASDLSLNDCVPYTKGIGFSVKKNYSDRLNKFFQQKKNLDLFAFISLSIYSPKLGSKSGLGIAFLEIVPARLPRKPYQAGVVVPLHENQKGFPLAVSETYFIDLQKNEVYKTPDRSDLPISLSQAFAELWKEHLATTHRFGGLILWTQLQLLLLLRKRNLLFISLIEFIVYISSGQTFSSNNESKNILDDADLNMPGASQPQDKNEWFYQWLSQKFLASMRRSDEADDKLRVQPSTISEKFDFHGIKVNPIPIFWFYLIATCFFFYKNITTSVGEMAFLNFYWNGILFTAPIFVLVLAWVVPNLGGKTINYFTKKYLKNQSWLSPQLAIRGFWIFKYFGNSKQVKFVKDDYNL